MFSLCDCQVLLSQLHVVLVRAWGFHFVQLPDGQLLLSPLGLPLDVVELWRRGRRLGDRQLELLPRPLLGFFGLLSAPQVFELVSSRYLLQDGVVHLDDSEVSLQDVIFLEEDVVLFGEHLAVPGVHPAAGWVFAILYVDFCVHLDSDTRRFLGGILNNLG